ncbi:carbon-nitrogen hydrolase family protein [Shewanella corallii]|uniref:Carbon-nitrogen hydrolase family protein n=1 Tax=Shewanella corallii TaxID=560080 RepID=A0ABT0NCD7_9GAMM|nr:carbon-nitrogen hydrolase family protein [Shewanella corallii]MCL2916022.1 carbon-nitrogen hydrolase family protein [Shewanella corallii]
MSVKFKAAVVQAAPVFMDLDASIDKAIKLIEKASQEGANIVAFSETWFPGYPWWIWLSPTAHNIQYFQRYHENSLVVGSDQFQRLSDAARENNIYLSVGASERDYGSLYIAQFLFSNTGELIQARRKLKPTHMERTVFGDGDGSDFGVFETEVGRIGQLCCWEHLQPLSKYAMFSMHEQVHIAAWPSFSTYPQAYSLGPQANLAASSVYAVEGQCFVLAPTAIVDQDMYDVLVDNDQKAALIKLGGGYAQIFGPDGQPLCERLPENEEGLLFAEIDLGEIAIAKSFIDPVGHYSRPDVLRLMINKAPQHRTEPMFNVEVESIGELSDDDTEPASVS